MLKVNLSEIFPLTNEISAVLARSNGKMLGSKMQKTIEDAIDQLNEQLTVAIEEKTPWQEFLAKFFIDQLLAHFGYVPTATRKLLRSKELLKNLNENIVYCPVNTFLKKEDSEAYLVAAENNLREFENSLLEAQ